MIIGEKNFALIGRTQTEMKNELHRQFREFLTREEVDGGTNGQAQDSDILEIE